MTKTTRGRRRQLAPTLGPAVCKWMERCLVHAEGDYLGKPFRLRRWQREIVYRAYELNHDGTRRYSRVLLGLPKGNGKTELVAGLACAELGGPVVCADWKDGKPVPGIRMSPDIPVAAASFEQANILFGAASTMIREGPLAPYFDVFETEIIPKEHVGRMYRVAAVAGTNDGRRPTFFAADELHEWTGTKERVHLVLSNGRAKRSNAWELAISTAGWDKSSLLGRMYDHGRRVAAGEDMDGTLLFLWHEASDEWDLSDRVQLEAAIKEANPAIGDFLPLESVTARYAEAPEFEFRRYHLNQWTSAPERAIPTELWSARAAPGRVVEPATSIVLGFDGSYNRDATALVGCTLDDPHLFVIGVWERPSGIKDWTVPREEVMRAIADAIGTYDVRALAFDDTFGRIWTLDLEGFEDKDVTVAEWPTRSHARMGPAFGQFFGGLTDGTLTHDNHPALTSHIAHCIGKPTRYGLVPTKIHANAEQHIDLAIAAVIAYDMATRQQPQRSVYEDRGVLAF